MKIAVIIHIIQEMLIMVLLVAILTKLTKPCDVIPNNREGKKEELTYWL